MATRAARPRGEAPRLGANRAVVRRGPAPEPRRPRVLVISGPNLERLGRREPEVYGSLTLAEIHGALAGLAAELGVDIDCRQSNHEGQLIDWINAADDAGFAGILLNPGALTHTSYALYDSLRGIGLPAVEVHLSNPDAREAFRRESRVAPACVGRVAGFGGGSYALALRGLVATLGNPAASAAP